MPGQGTAPGGLELDGVRSSPQHGWGPHHPEEHPGASVRLCPTSAGRRGDGQPRTAPSCSAAFSSGGSTDPPLLQQRPGLGRGYLGLQRQPSPGQGPVVQRAGLGQAEAKIRAHSSPASSRPARDCGSGGLGLLLPPHTDTGVTGGWFSLAQWPTMQQTGHQAGSAEACGAAVLVWEGLPLCWRQWKPPVPVSLCSAAAEEVRGRLRPFTLSHVLGPPRTRLWWGRDGTCSAPSLHPQPEHWGGGCCPKPALSEHLQGGLCWC